MRSVFRQLTSLSPKNGFPLGVNRPSIPTPLIAGLTLVLMTVGMAVGMVGTAKAQEAASREADSKAIQTVSQAFADAFQKGDAATLASYWTANGEYVNERRPPIRGRDNLQKMFSEFFSRRGEVSASSTTSSIRFLSDTTAIEEGTFTVKTDSKAVTSQYSSLYVQENGKWLIAMMKEFAMQKPQPTLGELEWLIGSWEAVGPDQTVRTTYEWAANKTFLRAEFTITPKGADKPVSTGVQIIGYDPVDRRIRSWTFDSQGSYGHWYWFWDGTRWSIESEATLASGMEATSLNLLIPKGDSEFQWRSVERTMNGQMLPDVGPIVVKKAAAN